jgi:hypothetical protein
MSGIGAAWRCHVRGKGLLLGHGWPPRRSACIG